MKKFISGLLFLLLSFACFAQGDASVNTGTMTSHLKIYVVLTVIAIILSILFGFLFYIERRISKLENK